MKTTLTLICAGLMMMGCQPTGHALIVDLRTDFRPGLEFVAVRTELVGADADEIPQMRTTAMPGGEDALRAGLRVAEFSGITEDSVLVVVALLGADGVPVAERPVRVRMAGESRGVTAVLTRSCQVVLCPGSAADTSLVACHGGACVSAECTPESPESCEPECDSDEACTASAGASCAAAVCRDGVCLRVADDALCSSDLWCDAEDGCLPRPSVSPDDAGIDGALDAGVDSGMDAAPVEDAGDAGDAGDAEVDASDGGADSGSDGGAPLLACPAGAAPIGGTPFPPDPVVPVSLTCGDGTLDSGEDCDDSGRVDGDGCSADCWREGTCNAPFDLLLDTFRGVGGEIRWLGELDTWPNLQEGSCSTGDGREVVFRFVPPIDGMLRATSSYYVDGTSRDPQYFARTRCTNPATELACNDDITALIPQLNIRLRRGEPVFLFFENVYEYAGRDELIARFEALLLEGDFCTPASGEVRCGFGFECRDDGAGATACLPASCGNGVLEDVEGCDDGNSIPGDGCSPACMLECGTCSSPLDLAAVATREADGTLRLTASHRAAPDEYDTICSSSVVSPELLFSFVADESGVLTVALDSIDDAWDSVIDIRTDCTRASSSLSCVSARADAAAATASVRVERGETYYVMSEFTPDDDALADYQRRHFELTARIEPFLLAGATCVPTDLTHLCGDALTCADDGLGVNRCVATVCGDGVPEGHEACDDGNTAPTDGCAMDCSIEVAGTGGVACADAEALALTPTGPTALGAVALGDTLGTGDDYPRFCGATGSEETVYSFVLTDTRNVVVQIRPRGELGTGGNRVSLQSSCGDPASAIGSCNYGSRSYPGIVAGTYYVVVAPSSVDTGGGYLLTVTATTPP